MALYRRISDILLMAMEKGMTVWSDSVLLPPSAPSRVLMWPSAVQRLQNTQSQLSQNSSSWFGWELHLGTTSLLCLAIKSRSWLTRKEGGRAWTPPEGIVISSRHTGHLQ